MKEIKLPFYSVFVCEICGYQSRYEELVEKCECTPIEKPYYKMGDKVRIGDEEHTVYLLRYSQTGEIVQRVWEKTAPHTLCVTLRQSHSLDGREVRAWEPGDADFYERRMTYEDLIQTIEYKANN